MKPSWNPAHASLSGRHSGWPQTTFTFLSRQQFHHHPSLLFRGPRVLTPWGHPTVEGSFDGDLLENSTPETTQKYSFVQFRQPTISRWTFKVPYGSNFTQVSNFRPRSLEKGRAITERSSLDNAAYPIKVVDLLSCRRQLQTPVGYSQGSNGEDPRKLKAAPTRDTENDQNDTFLG